jgi:serine/threonine protein kinase
MLQEMKRHFTSKADRAEMLRELKTVTSIPPHEHVVSYVRGWQEGGKLHIQMELCEGGSLDALLKRNDLCGEDQQLSESMLWTILRYARSSAYSG